MATVYSKVHFKDVLLTATPNLTTGTPASATINISSLKYTSETEWADVTDNTTPHKQQEPGYRSLSGTLEGFYDQANAFPFSDGDTAIAVFAFKTADTLTIPIFQIKSVDVSGDPGSALKVSMDWMASGTWNQTTGTTKQANVPSTGTGAGIE